MTEGALQDLRIQAKAGDVRAQVGLGNALLSAHPFGTPTFDEGFGWLERAAESGDAEAQWYLGCLHLQVTRLPDPFNNAARWFERAAAQEFAPAFDRLADLHLTGLGAPQDDTAAAALITRSARQGYPTATATLAYLHTQGLGVTRDAHRAARLHAQAVAAGHPPSYFALGLRAAAGTGIALDRALAHALLSRAADAEHPWARESAAALMLDLAERERADDWYARLKQNYAAANPLRARYSMAPDPLALATAREDLEKHLVALGHPAFTMASDGRLEVAAGSGSEAGFVAAPVKFEAVCTAPRVSAMKGFVTREECAHLMALVAPSLGDPTRYARGHAYADLGLFDGEGMPLTPTLSDPVVRLVERRTAEALARPPAHCEPYSVVRYLGGQQYKPHVDYFSDEQLALNRERFGDHAGQRLATFLVYLRAADAGGSTHYLDPNLTVRGEHGMAVLHWNCHPDGKPDTQTTHAGLPVEAGEKWLARKALRERAVFG